MKIGTRSTRQLQVCGGLGALTGAGLLLAACHPPHAHWARDHGWGPAPMSVGAILTCPRDVGGLSRAAQAADGQSCDYLGRGGEQVSLTRVNLAGSSPQDALAPLETSLRRLAPVRGGPASADAGDNDDAADDKDDDSDAPDRTNVDLPGIHVEAQGDKARVRVFGVTVNANGEHADVNVGQGSRHASVQAGPNGAEMRMADVGPVNARLALVLAADQPGPSGYEAVGYLARGPLTGPLVVASFKAKSSHEDWRGDRDLNALLAANVK